MTQPASTGALSRRSVLRVAGLAGGLVPFAAIGTQAFASFRSPTTLPDELAAPPICHAAAEVPMTIVPGDKRNLRLTWNASAICTVGVPVAQTKGYFCQA